MNRELARKHYLKGKRLKHNLFQEGCYIELAKRVRENKNSIPYKLFWLHPDYQDGWSFYETNQEES